MLTPSITFDGFGCCWYSYLFCVDFIFLFSFSLFIFHRIILAISKGWEREHDKVEKKGKWRMSTNISRCSFRCTICSFQNEIAIHTNNLSLIRYNLNGSNAMNIATSIHVIEAIYTWLPIWLVILLKLEFQIRKKKKYSLALSVESETEKDRLFAILNSLCPCVLGIWSGWCNFMYIMWIERLFIGFITYTELFYLLLITLNTLQLDWI